MCTVLRLCTPAALALETGIASETLVDNLRKLNLLASSQGADIVLVERIGSLTSWRWLHKP